MIRKVSIALLVLILAGIQTQAQQNDAFSGTSVIYKKELIGGIIAHTNGFGVNFKHSYHTTAKSRRELSVSFVSMKHEKEIKSFNPYYEDSKGYIFGKENSFFILRPTWGRRKILFDKKRERGVEVGYSWAIGPSLGFSKPIYLEIGHPSIPFDYITVERYDSEQHFSDNIFGKAPGSRGIDEIKFHPGIHGKFGLHFEHSNEKDGFRALEAGITVDAYSDRIPIMAQIENKQVFLAFYVNLLYGKKFFR